MALECTYSFREHVVLSEPRSPGIRPYFWPSDTHGSPFRYCFLRYSSRIVLLLHHWKVEKALEGYKQLEKFIFIYIFDTTLCLKAVVRQEVSSLISITLSVDIPQKLYL